MRVLKWILGSWVAALVFCLCVVKCRAQSAPFVRVYHDAFVSYYDQQTHNPAMVVYLLEARHFSGSYRMAGRHFKADTQLPRPRVLDKDFSNTGYVRGHLCSAGDRDSDKGWLKETYLTSNLVPMTMVCNSGLWKVIEDSCRTLALHGHRLLLVRGPMYYESNGPTLNVVQARPVIQVPDAFFCFGKCQDCGQTLSLSCKNVGTNVLQVVLHYQRDERISMLLTKILGIWSREEYEIITR